LLCHIAHCDNIEQIIAFKFEVLFHPRDELLINNCIEIHFLQILFSMKNFMLIFRFQPDPNFQMTPEQEVQIKANSYPPLS